MEVCGSGMSAGKTCGKPVGHGGKHQSAEALERQRARRATPEYKARQAGYAQRHEQANPGANKERARKAYERADAATIRAKWTRANAKRYRRARALTKLRRAAGGTVGRYPLIQGACWSCGRDFVSHRIAKFCSQKCMKREIRFNRRAAMRGCKVTPGRRHAVYERDNWICQLCMLPVNRNAVFPDPDYPTIDHVIPIKHHGAHAPENWQTAHFMCNSRKRDTLAA
jgi:5-methylcytosine-specific restriction endonuclease McrA